MFIFFRYEGHSPAQEGARIGEGAEGLNQEFVESFRMCKLLL